MEEKTKKFYLKDNLFNKNTLTNFAECIKKAYPQFKIKTFLEKTLKKFPELELKERIKWITDNLSIYLPKDYRQALNILLKSTPADVGFDKSGFIFVVYSDYVERYGCNAKYLKISLKSFGEFTKCASSEGAIRMFINKFPKETLIQMKKWATSKNVHQRRLASEGLRPKLPWCMAITTDYKEGAACLDMLYYDKQRYVTRSVANHLNDISKIDIKFVILLLDKWKKSHKQNEKEMTYIINHSLRTAIKRGDKNVLKFLGFGDTVKINMSNFKIVKKTISLGEKLEFSFDIFGNENSKKKEDLIIDYLITYAQSHVRLHTKNHTKSSKKLSTKVFKIKTITLKKNEKIHIEKKHLFKAMSTKKLYSGVHSLSIQINGNIKDVWTKDFVLKV